MKAAVFHKIGDVSVDNVADPTIEQSEDIILPGGVLSNGAE